MSLINKMLRDLDERHSEDAVAGELRDQIRSVPEHRRMHYAWWIVLVLTIMLIGVVSWIWGRQTAPAVSVAQPIMPPPQLALRLAPDLSGGHPPAFNNTTIEEKNARATAVAATPVTSGAQQVAAATASSSAANPVARSTVDAAPAPIAATTSVSLPATSSVTPPASVAVPSSPVPQAAPAHMTSAASAKEKVTVAPAEASGKSNAFDIPANITKQVKELTPHQRAENEYRKATVLLQQARTGEAAAVLEQVLYLDPHYVVARQTLVGLLLEGKRHDEAIRKLQDGLSLDKRQAGLAMMLARLQVEQGDLRPAVETLQRTLPDAAERADYQAFLAALFQRDARHREAVDHYLIALRKSPQNGIWWMGLAISLQAENRLSEARDAFGRAKASSTLSPELSAFVDQKLNQLR
jgi:MSHA biogenesis protein MshN